MVRSKREREGYPTRYNSIIIIIIIRGSRWGEGRFAKKTGTTFTVAAACPAPGHDDCIESRWYNRYEVDDVIVMRWLYGHNNVR